MKSRKILLMYCILFSCLLTGFAWGDILSRNNSEGNELFDAGQYDEALQTFTEADVNSQADDPRLPKLYKNIGNTLVKQGQHEQAVAMYQKALDASDNASFKSDVYYNTGNAWLKQRQYQQALDSYTQALELNPKHLRAQQNKHMVEKLLVQPPPQQQNQNNEKQENQEPCENPQAGDSSEQDQEQENQEQEEQQQEEQSQEEQQNQQQAQAQQVTEAEETPEEKEEQLSQEEALRILEALAEKEELLQQQPVQLPPHPVEKDW